MSILHSSPIMSSEIKPVEQNENNNPSSTQTTQSSPPPSKQEEKSPAKKQEKRSLREKAKGALLCEIAKGALRLFKRQEAPAENGKYDYDKIIGELTDFIESYRTHISDQKEFLESSIKDSIDEQLRKLNRIDDKAKKLKSLEDLKIGVMKLMLAMPSTNVGAEKKDPLKNLQSISSQLEKKLSGDEPKKLPQLQGREVFNSSMEFKHFISRYNELNPHKDLEGRKVQLCLLCFSIFPEGTEIKKRLMVQWWVAEGYAKTEEKAQQYFEKLREKGFIEAVNVNRSLSVGSCRIHPFNRSALVALAKKANFFMFEAGEQPTQKFEGCYQACLMGKGLISYEDYKALHEIKSKNAKGLKNKSESKKNADPDEEKGQDSNKKANDQPRKRDVLQPELEKLHLLMNVNEHILQFNLKWFGWMKNLNILYLGRWSASPTHHIEVEDLEFLEKGLVNTRRVKLLSLQGVSNIITLPDSILKLTDLTVLDLRACYNLENIPGKIGRSLERLTHLDMSQCYLLTHMPKSLSELKRLKVLKGFYVAAQDSKNKKKPCTLDDLKKLKELEKLCIYTNSGEFPKKDDVKALGRLEKLSKLTITWGVISQSDEDTDEDKGVISPLDEDTDEDKWVISPSDEDTDEDKSEKPGKLLGRLTKLDLKCFPMSKTPAWLMIKNLEDIEKLKKLYIRGGSFSDLGQYQAYDDGGVKKTWKVEQLKLKYLTKIDMEWMTLRRLFPDLKYLEQVSCPNLTLFPCDAKGVWEKEGSRH